MSSSLTLFSSPSQPQASFDRVDSVLEAAKNVLRDLSLFTAQIREQRASLDSSEGRELRWENGQHFLFEVYAASLPEEQEVARWSLVCKGWKSVIQTDSFRCMQLKLRSTELYQQVFPLSRLGLNWSLVYKTFIIQGVAQTRLLDLRAQADQLSLRQAGIRMESRKLDRLLEETRVIVENRRKENIVGGIFPFALVAVVAEVFLAVKSMR